MNTLHLLRSEPDEWVGELMRELSPDEEVRESPLHRGEVDYDRALPAGGRLSAARSALPSLHLRPGTPDETRRPPLEVLKSEYRMGT
jgi:hypothetical protein